MPTPSRHNPKRPRAFTLIEVVVVVVIITLLAALILVAVGGALRAARRTGEQQVVQSIKVSVENFRNVAGFLPPLVDDGDPIDTPNNKVRLRGEAGGPAGIGAYLRDTSQPRFSLRTIPIYLIGVLPKSIDGAEGPGFAKPAADGTFVAGGAKIDAMFDVARDPARLVRDGAGPETSSLLDRWNTPIRFYRWEPTREPKSSDRAGEIARDSQNRLMYNAPRVVGDAEKNPRLRQGGYAIVSAGADKAIDDSAFGGDDAADGSPNKDNIVEVSE
jgi:prepilin-type N-terminal cleavage/methylation domain-containing protein